MPATDLPVTLAFIQNIGTFEWIAILVVMLLLFGRRLPEVGKSLGRGIIEFKKGLKGIDEDIESQSSAKPAAPAQMEGGWQQQGGQLPANPYQHPAPAAGPPGTVGRDR